MYKQFFKGLQKVLPSCCYEDIYYKRRIAIVSLPSESDSFPSPVAIALSGAAQWFLCTGRTLQPARQKLICVVARAVKV